MLKVDCSASPTIIIFLHSPGQKRFKQFVLHIKIQTLRQLEKTLKERIWRDWTFTQHGENVLIKVSTNCWQPVELRQSKSNSSSYSTSALLTFYSSRLQQWMEERMTTPAERHVGNAFKLQFCILDSFWIIFQIFFFLAQMSSLWFERLISLQWRTLGLWQRQACSSVAFLHQGGCMLTGIFVGDTFFFMTHNAL